MSIAKKRPTLNKMLGFRASESLRERIKALARRNRTSGVELITSLVEFGMELDPELDACWEQVLAFAKVNKISPARAVAVLVERGLKASH